MPGFFSMGGLDREQRLGRRQQFRSHGWPAQGQPGERDSDLVQYFDLRGGRQRDLGPATIVLHNAADADVLSLQPVQVKAAEGAAVFWLDHRGKDLLCVAAEIDEHPPAIAPHTGDLATTILKLPSLAPLIASSARVALPGGAHSPGIPSAATLFGLIKIRDALIAVG